MDTKFSVAIHTLIMISETDHLITSEDIAISVGTNASYIRKILALLKKEGIVEGKRKVGGFVLRIIPQSLDLLRIWQAVSGEETPRLFDIHQNPNDRCIVGSHIRQTLTAMYGDLEESFVKALREKTLQDCINEMRSEIG